LFVDQKQDLYPFWLGSILDCYSYITVSPLNMSMPDKPKRKRHRALAEPPLVLSAPVPHVDSRPLLPPASEPGAYAGFTDKVQYVPQEAEGQKLASLLGVSAANGQPSVQIVRDGTNIKVEASESDGSNQSLTLYSDGMIIERKLDAANGKETTLVVHTDGTAFKSVAATGPDAMAAHSHPKPTVAEVNALIQDAGEVRNRLTAISAAKAMPRRTAPAAAP
jgi:hypothetical protein